MAKRTFVLDQDYKLNVAGDAVPMDDETGIALLGRKGKTITYARAVAYGLIDLDEAAEAAAEAAAADVADEAGVLSRFKGDKPDPDLAEGDEAEVPDPDEKASEPDDNKAAEPAKNKTRKGRRSTS